MPKTRNQLAACAAMGWGLQLLILLPFSMTGLVFVVLPAGGMLVLSIRLSGGHSTPAARILTGAGGICGIALALYLLGAERGSDTFEGLTYLAWAYAGLLLLSSVPSLLAAMGLGSRLDWETIGDEAES